jgi:hypothetical protein
MSGLEKALFNLKVSQPSSAYLQRLRHRVNRDPVVRKSADRLTVHGQATKPAGSESEQGREN